MKIGVISDTHDRIDHTASAIRLLTEAGAELLIHCGDVCSPTTVRLFGELPTHFVMGNNDDAGVLTPCLESVGAIDHGEAGTLTIAGRRIAWLHSHNWNQFYQFEHSGDFDFLFYGHTHVAESHRTGRTLVANPGAMHRARVRTCLLVDLATGEHQFLESRPLKP